jgi:predicted enzyme related to lactoylglutathione lyase
MQVYPRESIILVEQYEKQVNWYGEVMGFFVTKRFDEIHYCNLENAAGIKIAICVASEMEVKLRDRKSNSIVLQFAVDSVQIFLQVVESNGGTIVCAPVLNEKDNFWFASFADPEGNAHWIVDKNCP